MARSFTLSQLQSRVRTMSDMVSSSFVTDTEVTQFLNDSIAELYDMLVGAYGDDYFTSPTATTVHVTSSVGTYDLPSDFYKLRGVDIQVSSGSWAELPRASFSDRNSDASIPRPGYVGGNPPFGYRPLGPSKLAFLPTPESSETVRLWYVPAFSPLSSSSETFDGINGWEEYAVVDAAIKCVAKEESDTSSLELRKASLRQRIERMSDERDIGQPEVIAWGHHDPWCRCMRCRGW